MPASTTEDVQAAVVAAIGALGLTPAPAAVKPRKELRVLDGDRAFPLLLVAAKEAGEDIAWPGTWFVSYAVSVAAVAKNQGTTGDSPVLRAWLDAIWAALADWRTALAPRLADLDHTGPGRQGLFDPGPLRANFDVATLDLTVACLQKRY